MSSISPETVLLETLLARYGGNAISFGIGMALGTASQPLTRSAINDLWLLDPSMPEGAYLANTTAREAAGLPILAFAPNGEPIDIVNHFVNFGWEYVLHCHILSHEEMDMMRTQVVGVAPKAPDFLAAVKSGSGRNRQYTVSWTDTSKNETAFVVERSSSATGPWTILATVPSDRITQGPGTDTRTYIDRIGNPDRTYFYQVYAVNTVGGTWDYADPGLNNILAGGFPTLTLDSRGVASASVAAPSNLAASVAPKNKKTAKVALTWTDNSANETGLLVQRADNILFSLNVTNSTIAADLTSFTQDVAPGKTYYYRVMAFGTAVSSPWSNTASVTP